MPVSEMEPVVNDETWNAWAEKAKCREAATNRKLKVFLGIMLVLRLPSKGSLLLAAWRLASAFSAITHELSSRAGA